MATENEVMQMIEVLCATYPKHPVSAETIQAYSSMLAEIDFEKLKIATKVAIARCDFFPQPSEILKACNSIDHICDPRESAIEAWGTVMREVIEVSSYGIPNFKNPITAKVVRGLGWRNICLSENQTADRARFLEAYECECRREEEYKQLSMVPEVRQIANPEVRRLLGNVTKRLSAPSSAKLNGFVTLCQRGQE